MNSESIVALHCITGTHALIVLKEFQEDFSKNIDILTTCIVTHLISSEIGEYEMLDYDPYAITWDELYSKIEKESDVHAVKLVYTAQELNNIFPDKRLIVSAGKRLEKI